ncbi:MAG: DUF6644 family protein [Pseudomonadota bacterium]
MIDLLPLFNWLDTSLLATAAKAYGGVFAFVQMLHLLAMATLGGMVLVGDLRLLGLVMTDTPSETVIANTQRGFGIALLVIILSGVFMSAAVAMKLYYNEMFWAKMIGLSIGVLFYYAVRRPLLDADHSSINPITLRTTALASMTLWISVAACGRWIGFS